MPIINIKEINIPLNILKILILLINFKLEEYCKAEAIWARENIKIIITTIVRAINRTIRKKGKNSEEIKIVAK